MRRKKGTAATDVMIVVRASKISLAGRGTDPEVSDLIVQADVVLGVAAVQNQMRMRQIGERPSLSESGTTVKQPWQKPLFPAIVLVYHLLHRHDVNVSAIESESEILIAQRAHDAKTMVIMNASAGIEKRKGKDSIVAALTDVRMMSFPTEMKGRPAPDGVAKKMKTITREKIQETLR